ncbi:MAG: DNA polymerase III subunit delta' [Dokdonella sp.]
MNLPVWLEADWRSLAARLACRRLPHALLIAGAAGLGKRALADQLVRAALCEQRSDDGLPCTRCRSCLLLAAGTHPDRVHVTLELRDDGKLRSEITVEQIRQLSQRLSLSSQFGGLQLVIIEPADVMNANAANALLKTLEEPSASTVIVLVSDRPARLPATIRSRCQRIAVATPSTAEAHAWLVAHGIASAEATTALVATLGNPGRALVALSDQTLPLRADCLRDLGALRAGRASALAVAEAWAADRPADRLWQAAVVVGEEVKKLASGSAGALGLTDPREIPKLAAWFAHANRSRELLNTPLRGDLIILDLLHSWQILRRT